MMRLEIAFNDLAQIVKTMGADAVAWKSGINNLEELSIAEILLTGREISLDEVMASEHGLLTYRGEQVLLYIKDTNKDEYTLTQTPDKGPRFHVSECKTLDKMRNDKRFDRYVVTNNTSGDFIVEWKDIKKSESGETTARLKVCKNCLDRINYQNYSDSPSSGQKEIWKNFSIEEFFSTYKSNFKSKPKFTDQTAPKGRYAPDWPEISLKTRERTNWTCQQCGVYLGAGGNRHFLHVHHINGVKGDNHSSNLQVLCILCHSEQPNHQHINVKVSVANEIKALR